MSSPVSEHSDSTTLGVREELKRLLEGRELRNSLQLRKLLRFLVEQALDGRAEELKEYHLGLEVFQRGTDFDPRMDSIVRVQASILRKKLEAHYAAMPAVPGVRIRIRIPRGSYAPHWEEVDITPPSSPTGIPRRELVPRLLWGGLGALAGAGSMALLRRESVRPYAATVLWAPFLRPGIETIVSYGVPLFFLADEGLYVRDVHTNRPEEANQGRLGQIGKLLQTTVRPQEDVYTGIGEAAGMQMVSRFLEALNVRTTVANSHVLGPTDLSGKNLVIISSMRFQTLLDSLRLPHAFEFVPYGAGSIRNPRSLPGEALVYPDPGKPELSFARITIWPSASQGQRIVSLSGRETWSTQAAVQFVIDEDAQRNLQLRIEADPPTGPRGVKSEFLEILVEVEGLNNRAKHTRYVTHRYLDVPLPLRFR